MITRYLQSLFLAVAAATMAATVAPAAGPPPLALDWATVVNNTDEMPGACVKGIRTFNSYNQPSVNAAGLVVIRARSTGGPPCGPATHGIYTRDMSVDGSPIVRILDRTTPVPHPNNLCHQIRRDPVLPAHRHRVGHHRHPREPSAGVEICSGTKTTETRAGTTGIYANPFGDLITGASKLGAVPEFGDFFEVPGAAPWTMFDVFPGSPSVTNGTTIVFKGNYTVDGVGKTGVFYRDLEDGDHGGFSPVKLIANNTDTLIPGTKHASSAPPPRPAPPARRPCSPASTTRKTPPWAASTWPTSKIRRNSRRSSSIGERVPGEPGYDTFNRLGEGVAFDGRYVGFWGAWGTETKTVRLYCPTEGNKDRIAYCNQKLICDTGIRGDRAAWSKKTRTEICDGTAAIRRSRSRCARASSSTTPIEKGIRGWWRRPETPSMISSSGTTPGKPPCVGIRGHGQEGAEDDGEPARWRSSSFVAVSTVLHRLQGFFCRPGRAIYLKSAAIRDSIPGHRPGHDHGRDDISTRSMPSGGIHIERSREVGLEREGLRGDWLVINAKMGIEGGSEEEGMAGIYVTRVPITPPR